ncbi:MAG TPA: hypothetical protein ENK66_02835 [Arcobacter sp.]|nr:hypothetical protein [Arcobacter sp.]
MNNAKKLELYLCQTRNFIKNNQLVLRFLEKKLNSIENTFPFRQNQKMYEEFCQIREKITDIKDSELKSFIAQYKEPLHRVYIAEYQKIKSILHKIEKYSMLGKLKWSIGKKMILEDYNSQVNLFSIRYEYEMIHNCMDFIQTNKVKNLQDLYLMQLKILERKLPIKLRRGDSFDKHISLMDNILDINNADIESELSKLNVQYVKYSRVYIYLKYVLFKLISLSPSHNLSINNFSSFYNLWYFNEYYAEEKTNNQVRQKYMDEKLDLDEIIIKEITNLYVIENCENFLFYEEGDFDCRESNSIENKNILLENHTLNREDVKKRLSEKNLIHNHDKGLLVKEKHKKIPSNEEDIEKSSESFQDRLNFKNKLQNNQTSKLSGKNEQILKHKKETTQYDEEIDPDIIIDEKQYQKDFIRKIQEDIQGFDNSQQEEFVKKVIVVRKKGVDKKTKELQNSIKNYLKQTYKGYCQVCGFRFLIAEGESNGEPSFERFNWNDKRVVKQKKSFVTTADSLCLCRNCSANIKWGAFEPIFIDKIDSIENFANKSLDEIKDVICVKLGDEIVERFKDDYEWNDIYALEITVNEKPKNIYFTNEHLIQFIAYLQLEEKK